ncbi:MAG: hypothetical protein GF313_00215 [Caldithrix sp.]|nr:hypothetical protein [Caldithrix sp.]
MKRSVYPVLLLSFQLLTVLSLFSCQKNSNAILSTAPEKGDGLCIYKAIPETGIQDPGGELDVSAFRIGDKPIIRYSDITAYEIATHTITLNMPVDSLSIEKDVHGTPFILTLDGDKMHGGWFWTAAASTVCHWIVIVPDWPSDDLQDNQIKIQRGYPSPQFFEGVDPRNNPEIMSRLYSDGKAK